MQIKYLHGYRDYQINKLKISPNHPVAFMRWDALSRFEKALSKGLSSSDAARVVGIPRATLYSAKSAAQYAGWKRKLERPYAFKLKRGQKLIGASPGEVIQVDPMTVTSPSGHIVKHFNAVCTYSRWNVAEVFRRATATTASIFIDKLISKSPFKISQIQVDGGWWE
jgi:hypothetical protein